MSNKYVWAASVCLGVTVGSLIGLVPIAAGSSAQGSVDVERLLPFIQDMHHEGAFVASGDGRVRFDRGSSEGFLVTRGELDPGSVKSIISQLDQGLDMYASANTMSSEDVGVELDCWVNMEQMYVLQFLKRAIKSKLYWTMSPVGVIPVAMNPMVLYHFRNARTASGEVVRCCVPLFFGVDDELDGVVKEMDAMAAKRLGALVSRFNAMSKPAREGLLEGMIRVRRYADVTWNPSPSGSRLSLPSGIDRLCGDPSRLRVSYKVRVTD